MTDESPDTEEQLTSQDFVSAIDVHDAVDGEKLRIYSKGPIEVGVELDFVPIVRPGVMIGVTAMQERADMFKAMAFEADKEAKRLQERVAELESRLATASSTLMSVSGQEAKYRAALLDIEGRITNWADDNWLEPGMAKGASVLVASILAVVRRVK